MALDILIIAVIAGGAIIGFIRGAVSQVAMIAGIIAGIVAARLFGHHVAQFFAGEGSPDGIDCAIGYSVVFIGAYILAWIIVKVFRKTIHAAHLGIFDRVAGALIKGFVWTLALSIVLNVYLLVKDNRHELDHPKKPWRALVVRLAPATLGFLQHELKD